jgi:hypothetical protein
MEKNSIEYKMKTGGETAVKFAFIKFPGLLYGAGASPMKAENLSVKIEIDTNPPDGWNIESGIVKSFSIFQVNCYDIGSLFAGKLYACLYRKYTKARDYYDLLWYLTKKNEPNYKLLSNAATQTEKKKVSITDENIAELLMESLKKVDFKKVRSDVSRFLVHPEEADLLSVETFKGLVSKAFENKQA